MREKASHNLSLGLIYKGLGDLKKAEKLFIKKATHGELPEAHFIAGAAVAHQRNDNLSRDNYLERAFGLSASKKLPIAMIKKFEWMVEEGKLESAISNFEHPSIKSKKTEKNASSSKDSLKRQEIDKIFEVTPLN